MMFNATQTSYQCNGSAALAVQESRLVLLEGGLAGATPARRQRGVSGRLRPSQSRLALVAAAVVVALALAASALSDHVASEARARTLDSAPTTTVTVCAGESLWSIAGRHGVEGVPTQDVVSWIEARNSIEGGRIDPGLRIVVPSQAS